MRATVTPEDLGIDLEADAEDFTAEEAEAALDTSTLDDFVAKVRELLQNTPGGVRYEQRRRAGILYCRVYVGIEDSTCSVFRTSWLQRST